MEASLFVQEFKTPSEKWYLALFRPGQWEPVFKTEFLKNESYLDFIARLYDELGELIKPFIKAKPSNKSSIVRGYIVAIADEKKRREELVKSENT